MSSPSLSAGVLAGDPRAIARAISLIEDETAHGPALIQHLFPRTGRAYLVGITGAPGAGKSTLVDRLITELRRGNRSVGVIAVDPTSPFTGGALLGDRVRMQAHAGDPGVFIRSMATRGHLGGLARATSDAALVLDAAGKDTILIETVGVGQDEIDIVRTADVSVVTVVPGAGDEVQALKAGIMEIADIFVVNKADREGADRTGASIEAMLSLHAYGPDDWRPPILKTEATTGQGVPELVETIDRFRVHMAGAHGTRRRARAEFRVRELLAHRFVRHVEERLFGAGEFDALLDRIAAREVDPYAVVDDIMRRGVVKPSRIMQFTIDHVGIAVAAVDDALTFYRDVLGFDVEEPQEVTSQRVRVHFLQTEQANKGAVGGVALELLEATGEDSPIAKYLARRGPGIHHIAFRVPDITAALAHLKARGVRLVDETPRSGAHGSLVAFVHPSSTHGVLVELIQPQGGAARREV